MSYAELRSSGLSRCPNCPKDINGRYEHPIICPDGPRNASVFFFGERPGKEENSRGRCFIGMTGREFNEHYLPLAGLSREDVYVSNAVKCYGKKAPSPELTRSCSEHHLREEIARVRPKVIVPMGGIACSIIDDVDLEMWHGIPMENAKWWGTTIPTFPMWHPARGIHETAMMKPLSDDFIALGKYLRGELVVPVDEYEGREDYRLLSGETDLASVEWDEDYPVAIDTETDPTEGFWCLSFSLRPGTGYVIRRGDDMGLSGFRKRLGKHKGPIVFHNGMFDLPVLEEVGIQVPMRHFEDTMLRSYHLGYLPQGLKALAFRLCGMRMREFEDVVIPYSLDVMMDYVMRLCDVDWPKPEEQLVPDGDGFKTYKPQGLNAKLKRLVTDFVKNPIPKTLKRWDEWSDEEKAPAIERFGDMPKPSIKYVPIGEAVRYASQDADGTGRVRSALIRLKREIRKVL